MSTASRPSAPAEASATRPRPGRAKRRQQISIGIQAAVFVAVIAAILLAMDWETLGTSVFNFAAIGPMFPDVILVGLGNTLLYTVTSFIVGLIGGIVLALMRMSSFAPYRWIATAYTEFFRGVPALLVFIAFGYGVPIAFGVQWPIPVVVMAALGMVSAAYIAETLRAAVEALPPGQRLAALAMGMTPRQAFLLVLLPQAWRAALPPVTSQLLNLFKNASLAVAIGYPDLVSVAGTSLNQTGRAIECLSIVIAVYLLLSLAAAALSHRLEARSLRGTPR